jgi:hypothetical protein
MHVLNEVFSWEDITAQESEEFCSLLQGLLVPAHLFTVSASQEIDWVPHYRVFYDTVALLNLSFKEIMEQFRQGQYKQFKRSQLVHLITALFQDSDLRRRNLEEINLGVDRLLTKD